MCPISTICDISLPIENLMSTIVDTGCERVKVNLCNLLNLNNDGVIFVFNKLP